VNERLLADYLHLPAYSQLESESQADGPADSSPFQIDNPD
jgi:hypothetical protein